MFLRWVRNWTWYATNPIIKILGLTGLLFSSCTFSDLELDQEQATWALPLVAGEIDASDLLNQSLTFGEIRVANDGLISIHYSGDLLQKTKREIFFPIPGNLPIPMVDTFSSVTLPVVNNMIVHRAILANGNYWFSYSHQQSQPVNLSMWVPEMTINGQILSHQLTIPYGGQSPTFGSTAHFPLDNILMVPVNNKISLHYRSTTLDNQPINMTSMFFFYDQIDFKYIEGFIGQNVYDLKKDSIEFDLYKSFAQGGLYFDDPQITMTVSNSFGFPVKALVNVFEVQTAGGTTLNFTSSILDAGMLFNYPKLQEQGQSKTTSFVFNSGNSNVREIFNAQARRIVYDIDALSNPFLIPDSTFFIAEQSGFTINVTVDLPLKGKVSDYPAERTFEINAENLKDLKEGVLRVETDNGLPLTARAQIYLYNGSGSLLDSVFAVPQDIFKSAKTNAQGIVTSNTLNTLDIPVPENKIQAWSNTKSLRILLHFNSPADQNVVQISNTNKMKFRMGFIGKVKS